MTTPIPHDYLSRITPFTTSGGATPQRVLIDLTTNQETLGPSPKVLELYEDLSHFLHIYPDVEATELRKAIGEHFRLNPDQIICGNGSEEFIFALPRIFCEPGDDVIFSQGSFPAYKIATFAAGANPVEVPPQDFRIDVEGILSAITPRTKIIMIDNPGNPYSTYLREEEITRLIENTPSDILIMLDGAYAEYVDAADFTVGFEYVADHPNVLISRTFSKFYGLAGVRIGWAYAPHHIIEAMRKIKAPFNVGTLAQKMAIAALEDQAHAQRVFDLNVHRRKILKDRLEQMGFSVPESQCNFLSPSLSDPKVMESLVEHLAHNGIAVRYLKGQGFPSHFRFSLSKQDDMEALFEAIADSLQQLESAA